MYLEYASQTKLKQNSYNAPEYKQQHKIQKDLGGAL